MGFFMPNDFVSQIWVYFFEHVDGNPIAYKQGQKNQHREAHQENKEEYEESEKLNKHAC